MRKADPWRLYHIGDFFTDLALEILGGEKAAGSQDSGDIDNWELDAQIEVKGCGNRNVLKIYSKQLDKQLSELGFPFSYLLYVLFFYRNRWCDSTRTMSKETPTRKAMNVFLNRNIMQAFVVDGRVLEAIRQVNGLRIEQHAGEMAYAIRMSKRTFLRFVENSSHAFRRFGLRGFRVFSRAARLEFRGSQISFELTFILHRKQLKLILENFQLPLGFETPESSETQELPT